MTESRKTQSRRLVGCQCGQRIPQRLHRGIAVEFEAQHTRAARQPPQVAVEIADAVAWRGQHGFEQLEAGVQGGEKARLEQALFELV